SMAASDTGHGAPMTPFVAIGVYATSKLAFQRAGLNAVSGSFSTFRHRISMQKDRAGGRALRPRRIGDAPHHRSRNVIKCHVWTAREAAGATQRVRTECPLSGGEFNESTQHLLILADEEVCEWRGMHGHGSRRNRRPSCGSAGRAVNVWRTSRERLRGGTRAASIGSWLAMEGLLQRHAGGLW